MTELSRDRLFCLMQERPHPHSRDPVDLGEIWGTFELVRTTTAGDMALFCTEWELLPFAEWFTQSRRFLAHESFPAVGLADDESLAGAVRRIWNRPDEDGPAPDAILDALYDYRTRHSLNFAFRATKVAVPEIVLGARNSQGEVSCSEPWLSFCYPFDLPDFLARTEEQLSAVLTASRHTALTSSRIDAVMGLLAHPLA